MDHLECLVYIQTWQKKEKVEEDRFIRQREHEAYLARKAKEEAERAAKAARELTEAEITAKKQHDAVISEIFGIMSQTRDKVSDECIEQLAKWKIGK